MIDKKPGSLKRKVWTAIAIVLAALGPAFAGMRACAEEKACLGGVVTDEGGCIQVDLQ